MDFPYEKATTVSSEPESEARKSKIKWLHLNSKTDWVYNKIVDMAIEANTTWKFNLHSIIDSIQYTEYYEGGGQYDWHVDAWVHFYIIFVSCLYTFYHIYIYIYREVLISHGIVGYVFAILLRFSCSVGPGNHFN